jgi:hypothetical protein
MKIFILITTLLIITACGQEQGQSNYIRASKEEFNGFDYEADYDNDGIKNYDELKNNQDPYIANVPQILFDENTKLIDLEGTEISKIEQLDSLRSDIIKGYSNCVKQINCNNELIWKNFYQFKLSRISGERKSPLRVQLSFNDSNSTLPNRLQVKIRSSNEDLLEKELLIKNKRIEIDFTNESAEINNYDIDLSYFQINKTISQDLFANLEKKNARIYISTDSKQYVYYVAPNVSLNYVLNKIDSKIKLSSNNQEILSYMEKENQITDIGYKWFSARTIGVNLTDTTYSGEKIFLVYAKPNQIKNNFSNKKTFELKLNQSEELDTAGTGTIKLKLFPKSTIETVVSASVSVGARFSCRIGSSGTYDLGGRLDINYTKKEEQNQPWESTNERLEKIIISQNDLSIDLKSLKEMGQLVRNTPYIGYISETLVAEECNGRQLNDSGATYQTRNSIQGQSGNQQLLEKTTFLIQTL